MQIEIKNKKVVLVAATVAAAFGIGMVMQSLDAGPALETRMTTAPMLKVEGIKLTAATAERPAVENKLEPAPAVARPSDLPVPDPRESVPSPEIITAAAIPARGIADSEGAQSAQTPVAPQCDITLDASSAPAAMVALELRAGCLAETPFVLHHSGMMFSAVTDKTGAASLVVPALSEKAVFIVSFDNGLGAVEQIDVDDLDRFSRVVAQWRGEAGLGLHAREYEAAYFGPGHVHVDAPGTVEDATEGKAGVLTRFGTAAGANPLMAEVYTFPTEQAPDDGRIALSVEAEITAANCGQDVDAQTIEVRPGAPLRIKDLTLYMPECDAVGDFLVLKNLVEDMKLAAK